MSLLLMLFAVFSLGGCFKNQKQVPVSYKGHGSESVSPEVLAQFAPEIKDQKLISKIESMLDVRSTGGGELSYDGEALYFSWNVTGSTQIWKVNRQSTFPVQMTGGHDSTRLAQVSPNGKFLILTRDKKGDEYSAIYMQDVNGGPLQFLAGAKKVIASPAFVSKDSKYLYYTMNDKAPTLRSLYKMDLETKKSALVFKGLKGYMFVADHKGSELLLGNATGNISREYFVFNEESGQLSPVLGQGESESYRVQFSSERGSYLVATDKFGEHQRLYHYDGKNFKPITPSMNFNVESFQIDKPRKRILYTVNQSGYTNTYVMDAKTFEVQGEPIPRDQEAFHVYPGQTTLDGRFTTFKVIKAREPSLSYVYDWQTKTKSQWIRSGSPEINTQSFVVPTLESYKSRDGVDIPMFVWRPESCVKSVQPCPVIVSFHGGPESQTQPFFSSRTQLFLDEGYILVKPNVRGSSGYTKSWLHSDNGAKRLKVITDIEDAALHIKKNWAKNGVDPKIGVMGGSYGGYSVNVAMTLFAGAYDAGIAIVGMSDLVSFLENTGSYRRHLRVTEYGDPEKDLEALQKLSPINYLDKLKDPLLIIHGATDPRVPAGEAIQMYKALKKKNIPGELILFPDEGHGVRKRKNKVIYLSRMLTFFEKHLK